MSELLDFPSTRADAGSDVLLLAACGAALATLIPVALHQVGAIDHLPDPPGPLFDSDRITGSKMAHPLGVPDSLPGLASYATTMALAVATARASRDGRRNATAERLLGAKLVLDGGAALFNTSRQVVSFRALCSWCTGTAVCTAAMVFAGRKHIARLAAEVLPASGSPDQIGNKPGSARA